jgi:hypothetical protein
VRKSIHQLTREYVARTIAGLEKENKALKKTIGQMISRKPKRAAEIDAALAEPPPTHPTLRQVLPLLEQATALIHKKLDPEDSHDMLLGEAFAYSLAALAVQHAPFSRITTQTLIQQAYLAGVARCKRK